MKNRQKKFGLRMAVLALCLLVVSSVLSSCGYFTENFLAGYEGYYDNGNDDYEPDYFLDNDETTRRQPTVITGTSPRDTQKSPETTRAPETTRKPETTRAPETTRKPETTRAPETTEPDNIPDEFQNHVFLEMKDSGRCDELVGTVIVTVILVDDSEAKWSSSDKNTLSSSLEDQAKVLESSAAKYGKKLDISFSYISVSYSAKIMSGDDPESWQNPIAVSAGFSSLNKMQTELDNSNGADANPVAFALNKGGRAYASWATSTSRTERMTIFSSDPTSFSHELCHLFGAQDYYYPAEVDEAAEKHIPDSIMNSGDAIDAFTAFCIGWDDEIDKNAYDFLSATAHLTKEYLDAENDKQQTTGYVTNFYLANYKGTFSGYLDRGVPNGQGTMKYDDGGSYAGGFLNGTYHGSGTRKWANGDKYEGDWVNGQRHGKGTYTWPTGEKYEGDWVNSERTGQGTYIGTDGYKYTGAWVENKCHGYGKAYYTDGSVYEGYFVNGDRHGKGTYTWSTGDKYEGDWVNGDRTGQGTYTGIDGYKYIGAWKNSSCNGYGKAYYSSGAVYEGNFVSGKRDGNGTMYYTDGAVYTGSWKDGSYHGKGKITWSDGSYYEGDFVGGSRHGQGTYSYTSGSIYTGAWENGSRTGYGKMDWSDGSSYEGYWQNNKRHGYGTYVNKYGTVFQGDWINDVFQS